LSRDALSFARMHERVAHRGGGLCRAWLAERGAARWMAAIGERRSHTDTEDGSLGEECHVHTEEECHVHTEEECHVHTEEECPLREGPPLRRTGKLTCMAEPRRPGKGSVCGENLRRVGVVSPGCARFSLRGGGSVFAR